VSSAASAPLIPISSPEIFLAPFFDLLRNRQRQLHLNTLECLEALSRRYSAQIGA